MCVKFCKKAFPEVVVVAAGAVVTVNRTFYPIQAAVEIIQEDAAEGHPCSISHSCGSFHSPFSGYAAEFLWSISFRCSFNRSMFK